MATAEVVSAIPLSSIEHGRNPRSLHELDSQKELTESVRQHGVLQPIRVRQEGEGRFIIIAGHRRYEAAKAAELVDIPAVVAVPKDDHDAYVQSLVENLQREDLNPIDEARAFKALLDETGWSQEQLGQQVGRKQSTISNALRLLTLAEPVVEAIEQGSLSGAHGKALAALPKDRQETIAKKAIDEKMSSSAVEKEVAFQKEMAARTKDRHQRLGAVLATATQEQKESYTFWCPNEATKKIVEAAGLTAVLTDKRWVMRTPSYECECVKANAVIDEWLAVAYPACIVEQHYADAENARIEKVRKEAAAASKATDRARSAIAKHLRRQGPELSIDGHRLVLYMIATMSRQGSSYDARALVKRHGGELRDSYAVDMGHVWDVCQNMTAEDVVEEITHAIAIAIQPNTFTESGWSRWSREIDWRVRSYLHEQGVLPANAVYGKEGVPKFLLERYEKEPAPEPEKAAEPSPEFDQAGAAERVAKKRAARKAEVEVEASADAADPTQPVD